MQKSGLVNSAIIIALFVVVGPVIGLVTFATGMAIAAASFNIFAFLLLYGLVFAHFAGALPALIAGIIVAVYAALRGPVPLIVGALAGLVGLLGIHDIGDLLRNEGGDLQSVSVVLFPLTCIAASSVCTVLTRHWQRPAQRVELNSVS